MNLSEAINCSGNIYFEFFSCNWFSMQLLKHVLRRTFEIFSTSICLYVILTNSTRKI